MKMEEYNGWPNYPTWAAYTWISNEEGSYIRYTNIAVAPQKRYAARDVQEALTKDLRGSYWATGLRNDLETCAIAWADWTAITNNLIAQKPSIRGNAATRLLYGWLLHDPLACALAKKGGPHVSTDTAIKDYAYEDQDGPRNGPWSSALTLFTGHIHWARLAHALRGE